MPLNIYVRVVVRKYIFVRKDRENEIRQRIVLYFVCFQGEYKYYEHIRMKAQNNIFIPLPFASIVSYRYSRNSEEFRMDIVQRGIRKYFHFAHLCFQIYYFVLIEQSPGGVDTFRLNFPLSIFLKKIRNIYNYSSLLSSLNCLHLAYVKVI